MNTTTVIPECIQQIFHAVENEATGSCPQIVADSSEFRYQKTDSFVLEECLQQLTDIMEVIEIFWPELWKYTDHARETLGVAYRFLQASDTKF